MAITRNELAEYRHYQPKETKIIGDRAVTYSDVCVYEIIMGDVEDPDIFVADPIYKWQQTDAGKFVMEHAVEKPYWIRSLDYNSYGHVYRIVARLSEQDQTFWRLKWGGLKK